MKPPLSDDLQHELARISDLSQWEQSELGRALRRLGWTYTEIGEMIPAAKSTIAGWCRDISLTQAQSNAIRARTGSERGVPRDTQHRRRLERSEIIQVARSEASRKAQDPDWVAGVVLYWGEGFKTENCLGLANSDVDLVSFFMEWSRRYLDESIAFRAKLNLHAGNDETRAVEFWSRALSLTADDFNKTFIKPDGTGHRRNHLQHGVLQVRARKSTDHFLTTTGWIDGLRDVWKSTQSHD